MVARSWNRNWLEEVLGAAPNEWLQHLPSPYLCLPLISIIKIARECGWRITDAIPPCQDTRVVCLERRCTVAAEGCGHEFCTCCAMYLCSTNRTSSVAHGPPGSIPCPLCRHGIVLFVKLPGTRPAVREVARTSLSLTFCACSIEEPERTSLTVPFCKPGIVCTRMSQHGSPLQSMSCQRFPSVKFNSSLCMGAPDTSPSLVRCTLNRNLRNHLARCSRSELQTIQFSN